MIKISLLISFDLSICAPLIFKTVDQNCYIQRSNLCDIFVSHCPLFFFAVYACERWSCICSQYITLNTALYQISLVSNFVVM